jgi:hypothetical protein
MVDAALFVFNLTGRLLSAFVDGLLKQKPLQLFYRGMSPIDRSEMRSQ